MERDASSVDSVLNTDSSSNEVFRLMPAYVIHRGRGVKLDNGILMQFISLT